MLDHLVYATPDLERAIEDMERRTAGVRPAYGGKHAGGLTHNALLSLGEGSYLEIIAPVTPGDRSSALPFGLAALRSPRLLTWATAVDDMERRVASVRAAGYDPGEIVAGGRDLPDGGRLEWRLALRGEPAGDGIVPFLIEWKSEPHPSTTAPTGCRLVELRAEHPDPAAIGRMLKALEVDLAVARGLEPRLIVVLDAPNGRVELS